LQSLREQFIFSLLDSPGGKHFLDLLYYFSAFFASTSSVGTLAIDVLIGKTTNNILT